MVFALGTSLQAQVFTGNLTISTQADIDNFNFTEVTSRLPIQGANIVNLNGLSGLTNVGSSFQIVSTNITTFTGLEYLTDASAGSLILISSNSLLENLDALTGLVNMQSSLFIDFNASLYSLLRQDL